MKRLTIMTIAAAGLTFAATPAFAQSSYGGNTGNSYGNSQSTSQAATERAAKRAAKKAAKSKGS
jgi:hypothetical protein